jgi:hypothetical protein
LLEKGTRNDKKSGARETRREKRRISVKLSSKRYFKATRTRQTREKQQKKT